METCAGASAAKDAAGSGQGTSKVGAAAAGAATAVDDGSNLILFPREFRLDDDDTDDAVAGGGIGIDRGFGTDEENVIAGGFILLEDGTAGLALFAGSGFAAAYASPPSFVD